MDEIDATKMPVEKKLHFLEEISLLGKFHFQADIIIEKLLQITLNYLNAQGCTACVKDEEKDQIRIYWRGGKGNKKHIYPMTEEMQLLFSELEGRIYTSDEQFPLSDRIESLLETKHRNSMIIPLKEKEGYLGFIQLFNKIPEESSFSKDDLDSLMQYSLQIFTLIETAILFERLQERVTELNNIVKATESINSTLDLDLLLNIILEMGIQMLNAQGCSLLLIDEEKKCLNFTATSGLKRETIKGMSLGLGEGIAGWVAEKGEPLVINDISGDARFSAKIDRITEISTTSLVCVPMQVEDKIIGVMEIVNKLGSQKFTQRDLNILMTLATQAAIAINKAQLYKELDELFLSTIKAIAEAIEFKDPYTRGHCERIRRFCLLTANEINLSLSETKDLEIAALLHDLGKIGVPESILKKEEKLTEEDWEILKKHPTISAEILSSIKQLRNIVPVVRYHHEKVDGNGYPDGLKGEQIPLMSRIIAVCDAFDAMTSERAYREGISDEEAINELRRNAGSQFDTLCVNAFISAYTREFVVRRVGE